MGNINKAWALTGILVAYLASAATFSFVHISRTKLKERTEFILMNVFFILMFIVAVVLI